MKVLHRSNQLLKSSLLTGVLLTLTGFISFGQLSADDISAILDKEVQFKRCPSIVVGTIDATGKRQIVGAGSFSDKKKQQARWQYDV